MRLSRDIYTIFNRLTVVLQMPFGLHINNALEHGFYERRQDQIDVWFTSRNAPGTRLDVSDNGWGFDVTKATEGQTADSNVRYGPFNQP